MHLLLTYCLNSLLAATIGGLLGYAVGRSLRRPATTIANVDLRPFLVTMGGLTAGAVTGGLLTVLRYSR